MFPQDSRRECAEEGVAVAGGDRRLHAADGRDIACSLSQKPRDVGGEWIPR
jgi:hypothetical protein